MRGRIVHGLAVALLVALGAANGPISSSAASSQKLGPTQAPQAQHNAHPYQVGTASWYGDYFEGRPTASGEPFNMYDMTAAHLTLPLGTLVRVTNLRNHRSVIVRINDRGPYVDGRIVTSLITPLGYCISTSRACSGYGWMWFRVIKRQPRSQCSANPC